LSEVDSAAAAADSADPEEADSADPNESAKEGSVLFWYRYNPRATAETTASFSISIFALYYFCL
jgi:hypothetical protein